MSKDWDTYFMEMVQLVASKSKDRSTKIGAVIVGPDHEIRSTGYNSFPRGINDDVEERHQRPEKYSWMAHAERNACYNAARVGVPLKGCTMYTPGMPCTDCAIAIIQVGITEVVLVESGGEVPRWTEHHKRATQMLQEAGVIVRRIPFDFEAFV